MLGIFLEYALKLFPGFLFEIISKSPYPSTVQLFGFSNDYGTNVFVEAISLEQSVCQPRLKQCHVMKNMYIMLVSKRSIKLAKNDKKK